MPNLSHGLQPELFFEAGAGFLKMNAIGVRCRAALANTAGWRRAYVGVRPARINQIMLNIKILYFTCEKGSTIFGESVNRLARIKLLSQDRRDLSAEPRVAKRVAGPLGPLFAFEFRMSPKVK